MRHARQACAAAAQTPADRLAESYSALERKAQLYEKLTAGQHDDEDELYNVDFHAKGTLQEELQAQAAAAARRGSSAAAEGPIDSAADAVRGLGGCWLSQHLLCKVFLNACLPMHGRE